MLWLGERKLSRNCSRYRNSLFAQRDEKRSLPVMQLLVVWQDSWEDFD
jgi:hypothetical protein